MKKTYTAPVSLVVSLSTCCMGATDFNTGSAVEGNPEEIDAKENFENDWDEE